MSCQKTQEQLTQYLEGTLTEVANSEIKNHIKNCTNCSKELEELKTFFNILSDDKMEMPSANLKMNFDKILAEEIEKNQLKVVQLQPENNWKQYLRVAASVLIVLSAFLLGKYQTNITTNKNNQEKVLALLEDNSASKRILAVTNAEEFTNKDSKIIKALINRLFFDKNTNVRLAAAEALTKFSSEIMVRDALIKSLETDKDTSVQLELIQILAKIQEKRAKNTMEKMLKNEETPEFVKQQLQLNIPNLL
jgi:hypothetical protein